MTCVRTMSPLFNQSHSWLEGNETICFCSHKAEKADMDKGSFWLSIPRFAKTTFSVSATKNFPFCFSPDLMRSDCRTERLVGQRTHGDLLRTHGPLLPRFSKYKSRKVWPKRKTSKYLKTQCLWKNPRRVAVQKRLDISSQEAWRFLRHAEGMPASGSSWHCWRHGSGTERLTSKKPQRFTPEEPKKLSFKAQLGRPHGYKEHLNRIPEFSEWHNPPNLLTGCDSTVHRLNINTCRVHCIRSREPFEAEFTKNIKSLWLLPCGGSTLR